MIIVLGGMMMVLSPILRGCGCSLVHFMMGDRVIEAQRFVLCVGKVIDL
jgi:hypothetical protein